MATRTIKSPLVINIFWHNSNNSSYELAELMYGFFLRNPKNPLDRYLGISVNLFTSPPAIEDLKLADFASSLNVLLIGAKMISRKDWENFTHQLIKHTSTSTDQNHQLSFVALDKNYGNFSKEVKKLQVIHLYDKTETREKEYLLISIAHRLVLLLKNQTQAKRSTDSTTKLFLSHAKVDGLDLAEGLRKHLNELPGLDSFFDALDIPEGAYLSKELDKNIQDAILVIIHTDNFSSAERCRKQVLLAKKNDCPVIVVNQFEKGVLRSFPYIGNVPHINFSDINTSSDIVKLYDLIILAALREALKIEYHTLKIKAISKAFKMKVNTILSYPPELVTLRNFKKQSKEIILYPDPPIGVEELELLEEIRPELTFLTPTLLPLVSVKEKSFEQLDNLKIVLSLSESDFSDLDWIKNRSIENLMVEISRYLLVGGSKLIYSGDLNYESKKGAFNFSKLLIELVKIYKDSYDQAVIQSIDNYCSYPFSTLLDLEQTNALERIVNFIPVAPPEPLKIETEGKEGQRIAENIKEFNRFDKKYVWAKSLTAMRKKMMASASAVIILGGKGVNFKGKMPGILEEVLTALKNQKPIFLIGAFGGLSAKIIKALQGKQPEIFSIDYYRDKNSSYAHFIRKFNSYKLTNPSEKVDYETLVEYLNNTGKKKNYGLNNNLSKKENERLFTSNSEIEIISLILKGLQKISFK